MKPPSRLARAVVLMSSLTLLAGYVVYSHVTPNSPPPDPLGLNMPSPSPDMVELTLDPEVVEFEDLLHHGEPASLNAAASHSSAPPSRPSQELRIISSKVINQPVFSVRNGPYSRRQPLPKQKPKVRLDQFGVQLDGGLPR